jgi:hypothetical protein
MTDRFKQTVEQAAAVLPPEGQDQLVEFLALLAEEESALAELLTLHDADDDAKWDAVFAESGGISSIGLQRPPSRIFAPAARRC